MDPKWLALMKFCKDNPYATIEKLEIFGGVPVLVVQKRQLTDKTVALVKVKL